MNTLFSVTSDGVITVDTSKIKESFQEAYKGALGSDLNLEDSTVQGQLILNDTENLTTTMNEVVTMANSFPSIRQKERHWMSPQPILAIIAKAAGRRSCLRP